MTKAIVPYHDEIEAATIAYEAASENFAAAHEVFEVAMEARTAAMFEGAAAQERVDRALVEFSRTVVPESLRARADLEALWVDDNNMLRVAGLPLITSFERGIA